VRTALIALALLGALLLVAAPGAAAAVPPSIASTWVTEVTASSANLRAEINPQGHSTTYRFEYLTEAAYEANLAAVPPREGFSGAAKAPPGGAAPVGSGTADVAVVQHLAALSPVTTYRLRDVVTYPEGTVTGPTRSLGTEAATSVFSLPDNRGWEMVSPIDKNGGAIQPPESIFGGGVFQASSDGDSLTYSSADSFGAEPRGAPPASQYIATRGAGGWSTQNVTEPTPSGGYSDHPDGVPFQLFSTDLARGLLLDGRRCEAEPCPRAYSLRDSATGALTPLPEAPGLRVLSASPDLSQIVFESEGSLYRWSGGGLVPITLLPPTAGPGAAFQLASTNGRFTFYTEGGHLYRYDASDETATDLTPAGGVAGVLGASEDGASVYYQDAAGLQRWHAPSSITLVAGGAAAAAASDYPPATGTARVSPDGSHLAFVSSAELTGYENDGASEVFLYAAPPGGGAAKLSCVSCNPTGERPRGDSWIPGALANGQGPNATRAYKPRSLSADGQRVFFNSADRLAIQDSNGRPDVYEWEAPGEGSCAREGGCLGLISSGRSGEASTFIDASANGSDAFFLTDSSLYPPDPGSLDLYDAREGGGFPAPPNLIPCDGDACQPLPEAPEDPTPGTLVPNAGNPPLRILAAHGKRHRHRAKHSKHRGRR
jgi:hypothetical protein